MKSVDKLRCCLSSFGLQSPPCLRQHPSRLKWRCELTSFSFWFSVDFCCLFWWTDGDETAGGTDLTHHAQSWRTLTFPASVSIHETHSWILSQPAQRPQLLSRHERYWGLGAAGLGSIRYCLVVFGFWEAAGRRVESTRRDPVIETINYQGFMKPHLPHNRENWKH